MNGWYIFIFTVYTKLQWEYAADFALFDCRCGLHLRAWRHDKTMQLSRLNSPAVFNKLVIVYSFSS